MKTILFIIFIYFVIPALVFLLIDDKEESLLKEYRRLKKGTREEQWIAIFFWLFWPFITYKWIRRDREYEKYPGMTKNRYEILMGNSKLKLRKLEIEKGWHFCYNWDGLLIHKSWKEFEHCSCINKKIEKNENNNRI